MLGDISLSAMGNVLVYNPLFWQSRPVLIVFYGAAVTHMPLRNLSFLSSDSPATYVRKRTWFRSKIFPIQGRALSENPAK
jgi:hypothetical protein